MQWIGVLGLGLLVAGCQATRWVDESVWRTTPDHMATAADVDSGSRAAGVSGYVRGTVAEIRGDAAMAGEALLAALVDDPDNTNLRARVFEQGLLKGDIPTATRLARTMPVQDGQFMPAIVQVAGAVQDGKLGKAQEILARLITLAPDLLPLHVMKAYIQKAQGSQADNIVAALYTVQVPAAMEARKQYHIARLWQREGQQDNMMLALETSNQLEPGSLFTTLMLAEAYRAQGQHADATALYDTFRERNPLVALLDEPSTRHTLAPDAHTLQEDMAFTLFDFGLMVWTQGAVGPSRQLLNLALTFSPTNPYLLYYAGVVDESAHDYTTAQSRYGAVDAASPVGLAARVRLAEATFRGGEKDAGVAMARQLVRARPDVQAVQRSLAEMAFDNRDYATALQAYNQLLGLQKGHVAAPVLAAMYFARGASHERLGRYERAAQDLALSLVLNPANPSVLNYLGYMWADRAENLREATIMLERAHELAPEDGAIMDSLAWAYFKVGDAARALPLLERSADLTPDDATVFYHLGEVHAALGHTATAQRYWRMAKTLLKDTDDAHVRRGILGRLRGR